MNGELVKRQDRWDLYAEDGSKIGSSAPNPMNKLSLKNCEAIENGYDLDELAEKHYNVHIKQGHTKEDSLQRKIDFILGFQKAIELLGDKKFSEEDIKNCWNKAFDVGYNFGHEQGDSTIANEDIDNYIQSLQQTEWDVDIEMDFAIYPANLPKEGEERPVMKPKLDKDGCLILKRK